MDRHPLRRIGARELPRSSLRLFNPEVDAVAARVIREVSTEGEQALRRWAEALGEAKPGDGLFIDRQGLKAAWDGLEKGTQALLERAQGRVAAFAAAQKACLLPLAMEVPGGRAGHDLVPVARAGCYVPGGRYPLPSSAIMTVTPAVIAGVPEVFCSGPKPTAITLAASYIARAAGFLTCGGAHGITALAFGILVPPCDVIVGPGGPYVASAKRQLFGLVGTEAPAGPSELLIIADQSAEPDIVAADMLAQAEHDTAAWPMLICETESFARRVETQIALRLAALPEPNATTARRALENGWIMVETNKEVIGETAERCAPEHLELHVENPWKWAQAIRSAGAVFLGTGSAEVFGDYGAGPNHTLPTGGAARFAAGLSVLDFLRARTWLDLESGSEAKQSLAADTQAFAALEGLGAHAAAAGCRSEARGI
ncbi:MAG: histidinol dehydrogenase [Spirochaetes bacterium]|nr:MAG: histidinol dehydrogenase [Spirochaetota bacterium]